MNNQATSSLDGVLLIDKPSGMTSHDVVDRLRRKLHIKKVGHAGTLDPNATGLLVMLIGKATKVSQYIMSLDKEYEGVVKLGEETNTYDCDGEITLTAPVPGDLNKEAIEEIFRGFVGDQYQMPPMFSAKKVNGVPLYKHARKGNEIERDARFIRIVRMDVLSVELPEISFRVHCSKGTYVRTIAHDIGQKIGCGAHLSALRRTASDRFSIKDALTLEKFEALSLPGIKRHLIPVYQAVPSHVL